MPLNGARTTFFGSVALILGPRTSRKWQMSAARACHYLDGIGEYLREDHTSTLPNPTGLYISGAEPFSQLEDLEALLGCAARNKMASEVVTTVFWAESLTAAVEVLKRLRPHLHLLTIFINRADLTRFGVVFLENALLAARQLNLSFQIHVGLEPGQPFPREILGLEVVNCDTSVIRVEPTRGAVRQQGIEWPSEYLLTAPPRYARCAELMGFVVVPGGDVYPCAGGVGIKQLCLGNLETDTVATIAQKATARAELRQLRNQGPFFLYEESQRSPALTSPSPGYLSSCDFHRQWLMTHPNG